LRQINSSEFWAIKEGRADIDFSGLQVGYSYL
jgi:hypothetical protein